MLDWLWPPACPGCGAPGAGWCAGCRADVGLRPVPLADLDVCAVAPYAGPLGSALRRAKYGPDRRLAVALAGLLAGRVGAYAGAVDAVVPVPSPWTRRVGRGFAVASLLAEAVGAALAAPVIPALRLSPGARQAALGAEARARNLDGRVSGRAVSGRVLLVDDAVTTGATARACAEVLRDRGAARVRVLALLVA